MTAINLIRSLLVFFSSPTQNCSLLCLFIYLAATLVVGLVFFWPCGCFPLISVNPAPYKRRNSSTEEGGQHRLCSSSFLKSKGNSIVRGKSCGGLLSSIFVFSIMQHVACICMMGWPGFLLQLVFNPLFCFFFPQRKITFWRINWCSFLASCQTGFISKKKPQKKPHSRRKKKHRQKEERKKERSAFNCTQIQYKT